VVPSALTLLDWWDGQRRELPWRQTRDPWAVLICEVMAQQTQVGRVAERWQPFLERFPSATVLANVPAAEVSALVGRLPEPFPLPYRCRIQWCFTAEPS